MKRILPRPATDYITGCDGGWRRCNLKRVDFSVTAIPAAVRTLSPMRTEAQRTRRIGWRTLRQVATERGAPHDFAAGVAPGRPSNIDRVRDIYAPRKLGPSGRLWSRNVVRHMRRGIRLPGSRAVGLPMAVLPRTKSQNWPTTGKIFRLGEDPSGSLSRFGFAFYQCRHQPVELPDRRWDDSVIINLSPERSMTSLEAGRGRRPVRPQMRSAGPPAGQGVGAREVHCKDKAPAETAVLRSAPGTYPWWR
jgi:hypothetical protein